MKCLYYLAPSLASTQKISQRMSELGVQDWFLHVISKDEAGLKQERIQSGNYLETTDLIRDGLIGANLGFIGAVLAAALVMFFQPFGAEVPKVAYFFIVLVFTMFGAWVGGLIGLDNENRKLRRFHDDIEQGAYLVLIYVLKEQEQAVRAAMRQEHAEARLAAVDRHFLNPFKRVRRRRRQRGRVGMASEA